MHLARLVALASICLCGWASAAGITIHPQAPTTEESIQIQVDGQSNSFPVGGLLRRFYFQGNVLTVEGCHPVPSFSAPINYTLHVVVGSLPAGSYVVRYESARCDFSNNPLEAFRLEATLAFSVAFVSSTANIPTLTNGALAILAMVLTVSAWFLHRRQSKEN
jgi:hypothetical protein